MLVRNKRMALLFLGACSIPIARILPRLPSQADAWIKTPSPNDLFDFPPSLAVFNSWSRQVYLLKDQDGVGSTVHPTPTDLS